MFVKTVKAVVASAAALMFSAGLPSTAHALLVTTSGTTSGGAVSATADFELVGNTLEIFLTNTTASITSIGQVLDGLSFTLVGGSVSGPPVVVPDPALAGSGQFLDCTGVTCAQVSTFQSHQNGNGACTETSSPFCWSFSGSLLSAGNGSFKPAGIVNLSTQPGNGNGGPGNSQHNDYLLGTVEFDLTVTGNPTSVSDVLFYWGTQPETTTGTCTGTCVLQEGPEPGSLALIGLALSGLAWSRRRSKA